VSSNSSFRPALQAASVNNSQAVDDSPVNEWARSYRLACFRRGFIGRDPHPLRRVQAMIRARAADRRFLEELREALS
jgi:hypothetical protein